MNENGNASVEDELIQKALQPLMKEREGFEQREGELRGQLEALREERKKVDKILRAAGMIDPYKGGRKAEKELPRGGTKNITEDKLNQIRNAVELVDPKGFNITALQESGAEGMTDRTAIKIALEHMRDTGELRFLGNIRLEGDQHKAMAFAKRA